MRLASDFEDYYDTVLKEYNIGKAGDYTLNRVSTDNVSKVKQLEMLRGIGYETIQLMPVRSAFGMKDVLVYTNPNLHYGGGKSIMSMESALEMYGSALCTEYFPGSADITYKILQIGKVSLSLEIGNNKFEESELKSCIYLGQLEKPAFNGIYSIDFVRDNSGKLLACDLDLAVKLGHIKGIDDCLKPDSICKYLMTGCV